MADEFETVELEYSEDDVLYYIVDEDDNEIGFALEEDGHEVEYYYEGFDGDDYEVVETIVEEVEQPVKKAAEPQRLEPEKAEDHGRLHKLGAIASFSGNKARKRAEAELDKVRSKAEVGVDKATEAVESGGKKIKEKTDGVDLGITRESVAETTADLNAIAKEGAETAKELKEAYDEIMDSFGFLVPKKVRRRLP
jgi:hypothetical protein